MTGIGYEFGQTNLGNLTYSYDLAGRRISMGGSLAAVLRGSGGNCQTSLKSGGTGTVAAALPTGGEENPVVAGIVTDSDDGVLGDLTGG